MDKDGGYFDKDLQSDQISIRHPATVVDFKNAAKERYNSDYLKDISAGRLKVYKREDRTIPLEADSIVDNLGRIRQDALIIMIPSKSPNETNGYIEKSNPKFSQKLLLDPPQRITYNYIVNFRRLWESVHKSFTVDEVRQTREVLKILKPIYDLKLSKLSAHDYRINMANWDDIMDLVGSYQPTYDRKQRKKLQDFFKTIQIFIRENDCWDKLANLTKKLQPIWGNDQRFSDLLDYQGRVQEKLKDSIHKCIDDLSVLQTDVEYKKIFIFTRNIKRQEECAEILTCICSDYGQNIKDYLKIVSNPSSGELGDLEGRPLVQGGHFWFSGRGMDRMAFGTLGVFGEIYDTNCNSCPVAITARHIYD